MDANRNFRAAETSEFYFVATSVRKSVLDCGPAAGSPLEHVRMKQVIEERRDGDGIRGACPVIHADLRSVASMSARSAE